MLWTALNVPWQQHMNNQELHGSLPTVSESLRARRLTLAGHWARHNEETALKAAANLQEILQKIKRWIPIEPKWC